ncbi:hypothetical protein Btru_053077 [Bulinus truncatus]|nr:hypothetical protein Btru_053077 [Bulinus truncatus]
MTMNTKAGNIPHEVTSVKLRNALGADTLDQGKEVPINKQVKLIVAALRALNNEQGSTVSEIKRLLCSQGCLNPSDDLRTAIILALKKQKIRRPMSAVKAGVYGKYVLVADERDYSLNKLKKNVKRKPERRSKPGKKNAATYRVTE